MNRTVTRGRVIQARIRGGRTIADIEMLDGETRTRVEIPMSFGISAVPSPGADVVVLEVGSRDHLVALMADDATTRVTGLVAGDVAIRAHGQTITINAAGIRITDAVAVEIESAGEVTITAPKVTIAGDMDVTGTLTLTGPAVNLNTHVHGGVDPGGGNTAGPA